MDDPFGSHAVDNAHSSFQALLSLRRITAIDEGSEMFDLTTHLRAEVLIACSRSVVLLQSFNGILMMRHGALQTKSSSEIICCIVQQYRSDAAINMGVCDVKPKGM